MTDWSKTPSDRDGASVMVRLKLPSDDQIDIACMWLRCNEKSTACEIAAKFLKQLQADRMFRDVAREAGVSPRELKRRLAGRMPADNEEEN